MQIGCKNVLSICYQNDLNMYLGMPQRNLRHFLQLEGCKKAKTERSVSVYREIIQETKDELEEMKQFTNRMCESRGWHTPEKGKD